MADVIEFKVHKTKREKDLQEIVDNAFLAQMEYNCDVNAFLSR